MSQSSNVRLGVVGAGEWCRAAHLPSLREHPRANLAAIASRTRASAEDAAAQFGVEHVAASWREMLEDTELDAVIVTAPAAIHAEIACAAFERGLHVLCEAPLAMSAADGAAMLVAAERAGRLHGYSLPRPFLYGGARVAQHLAAGAIGTPASAALSFRGNPWLLADPSAVWRARADSVPPLLIGVCIGVLGELLGDVTRVVARLERIAPSPGDGTHAPAPDYFSAQWEFASGVRATLDAGTSPLPPPGSGLTIFGSEGSLVWDWTTPGRVLHGRPGQRAYDEVGTTPAADLAVAFPFARDFVDAIQNGRAPAVTFAAGLRELRVIEACQRSARAGTWVDVVTG